jgi:hypothetical protein
MSVAQPLFPFRSPALGGTQRPECFEQRLHQIERHQRLIGRQQLLQVDPLFRRLHFLTRHRANISRKKIEKIVAKITKTQLSPSSTYSVPEKDVKTEVTFLFSGGLARNTLRIWTIYLFNWVTWLMFLACLPTALKTTGLPADAGVGCNRYPDPEANTDFTSSSQNRVSGPSVPLIEPAHIAKAGRQLWKVRIPLPKPPTTMPCPRTCKS